MYQLYHEFAHRYDLHTPPGHYKHDHAFVIEQAQRVAPRGCRLLDVGCGTGVFLETALAAGIDGYGIDAALEMIDVARERVGADRVRIERMQDLSERKKYHVVTSLSWTIHYCETEDELVEVVGRCRDALLPGGLLILQVADDDQMTGAVSIDRAPDLSGTLDGTLFIHRFRPLHDAKHQVLAEYVYVSQELEELLAERHMLQFANPAVIASTLRHVGFNEISIITLNSITPFVLGAVS